MFFVENVYLKNEACTVCKCCSVCYWRIRLQMILMRTSRYTEVFIGLSNLSTSVRFLYFTLHSFNKLQEYVSVESSDRYQCWASYVVLPPSVRHAVKAAQSRSAAVHIQSLGHRSSSARSKWLSAALEGNEMHKTNFCIFQQRDRLIYRQTPSGNLS